MYKATITWVGSPEHTLGEFRLAVKPELAWIGGHWHSRYLPGHFEQSAAGKYGYKRRGKQYLIDKARAVGHTRPLEYTGDMKAMLTRMARISSTAKGAKVAMTGPRYLYAFRKDLAQPDKAAEVTATNTEEATLFAQLLDRRLTRRLNGVTTTQTTRST